MEDYFLSPVDSELKKHKKKKKNHSKKDEPSSRPRNDTSDDDRSKKKKTKEKKAKGASSEKSVSTRMRSTRQQEVQVPPDSQELEELQRSLERIRKQREMVEKIKRDSDSKDRRIAEMEKIAQKLRSQLSQVSLQALERERALRAKLVEAEQLINHTRANEEAVTFELKRLLGTAQSTESELRAELSRAKAELQEKIHSSKSRIEQLETKNLNLSREKSKLEEQVAHLRQSLSDKNRSFQTVEEKHIEATRNTGKRMEELEVQLGVKRSEIARLQDKVDSLLAVHTKQKELLHTREEIISEAENRERLLQGTITELEENMNLLREQVSCFGQGDSGVRQQLQVRTKELEEAEKLIGQLRQELFETQFQSRSESASVRKQENLFSEYQETIQRAGVHRQRMELQLQSLSEQVQALQKQLVQEMAVNASLGRQLEEERNSRSKISKQRLKILSEFYDEESKLKETLGTKLPASKNGLDLATTHLSGLKLSSRMGVKGNHTESSSSSQDDSESDSSDDTGSESNSSGSEEESGASFNNEEAFVSPQHSMFSSVDFFESYEGASSKHSIHSRPSTSNNIAAHTSFSGRKPTSPVAEVPSVAFKSTASSRAREKAARRLAKISKEHVSHADVGKKAVNKKKGRKSSKSKHQVDHS